jgi:hypothetical protein
LHISCVVNAGLQVFYDPVERRFSHSVKSNMSATNSIPMPPESAALKGDEVTISGLRLIKSFLQLRNSAHREELIALAERLMEQESKFPAAPGD